MQQDTEPRDTKSQIDRAETSSEEPQKQKSILKNEKHVKKDDSEIQSFRSAPRKEARSSKDKNEKEKSISEDKLLVKHKCKGDVFHKTDDKAERKNKHRSERKTSANSKDLKSVSEHAVKNEESSRKENRKDRQGSIDKSRADHKSKRLSSDLRPQKESLGTSKQHSFVTSRKGEGYSEDKHDAESTNSDNTLKQGDSIHKDRRKSKNALEEKLLLKSRSKSHSKQGKIPEPELQESSSKQESGQKSGPNSEESDPDKQCKSKTEIKGFEENSVELDPDSGAHSVSSSQKDFSHRVKSQSIEKSSAKERNKSDKDLSSSRLERKTSAEGHKSRSLKHNSKDMKKREDDNKPDDKAVKQVETHSKLQENLLTDKRTTKKSASESRKGSFSFQEIDKGEEKSSAEMSVWTSGHMLHSEECQEPMDIQSEQRDSNAQHQITQPKEISNNSQQETKFKNIAKDQMHHNSLHELNKTLPTKEISKSSPSGFSNPKQKFEKTPTKEMDVPSDAFKSEESSSPTKQLSNEGVVHQKSMAMTVAEVKNPLSDVSMEESFNLDRPANKDTISDNEAHTAKTEQHGSIVFDGNIKESDITDMEISNTGDKGHLSCKEVTEEKTSGFICIQEGTMQKITGIALTGSMKSEQMTSPTIVFTEVCADKGKTNENHTVSGVIELSSGSVPKNTPEEIGEMSMMASKRGGDLRRVTEDKNENNVVGSSVGSSSSCVSISNSMETEVTVIGTSTERTAGSAVTATSTGGSQSEEGTSVHLQREGDATITCSEEKSETALSCTSIEADEGFTVGCWTPNKEGAHSISECPVTATEESGVGTEGLSVCESSSTKEEESGECIVNYAEEHSKQLISETRVELEQTVNSVEAEEKDDAVTSAGSEERCVASVCSGTSNFDSATTCLSEVESDGAVTSAGTEAKDRPVTSENPDEFRSNAAGSEHAKAAEGAVTCTAAERGSPGSAICSVTGTDSQDERAVTGVCAQTANNVATGPHADKSEDIVNGESAVTSTGITAEDGPEAAAACTGLEDSNEGFAAASDTQEKYEFATDSTAARAETNIIDVSQGSYDDEGCVTSTGAKEDDDEGENFVTSTGRGNEEVEQTLTCTGTEESERVLICVGAKEGGSSSICLAAGQLRTDVGELTSDVDKGAVDSMTGLEKDLKIDDIHNSTKGVVESSTTSVGVASENVMAFGAKKESQFTENYECDVISATSKQGVDQVSAVEEKNEDATSFIDIRKSEGPFRIGSKKVAVLSASANEDERSEGETISTSVVKVCPTSAQSSAKHVDQTPLVAKAVENLEKTPSLISTEDFNTPMPSTAVEYMNQDGTAGKQNNVSTSILEEFEAPMPSAAIEDGKSAFLTIQAAEKTTTVEMDAIPMPSMSTGSVDEGNTVHSKEERDECTVISTSIVEELETSISQERTEDADEHFPLRLEQTADTAMISTSSVEQFETSVSPVETQEIDQVCRTQGRFETSTISTTEGCDKTIHGAFVPVEAKARTTGAGVSTDGAEHVQEATSQEIEFVVQNTENNNQSAVILVQKGGEYDALGLSVATAKPDKELVALSADMPEDSIAAGIVEECDSVSTVAVSEKTPLEFSSKEVEDQHVLQKESQRFHQGEPEGAVEELTTDDTTSTEMPENTVQSDSIGESLGTEILNPSVSDGTSTEDHVHECRTQESGQHTEVPSGMPLEEKSGDVNLAIDDISHKPVLETDLGETMDLPNRKCSTSLLVELGGNSKDRALGGGTVQGRHLADIDAKADGQNEEEAFSQEGSAAYQSDSKEIHPIVTEELEQRTRMTAIEDPQCRSMEEENLSEEIQPELISKALETTDTSVVTEAVEVQVSREKSLELQVEMPDQKEESFMPETDRHPGIEEGESDHGPVCQILGEEAEESQYFEARAESNTETTSRDSEDTLEGDAKSLQPSSETVEGKDEIVGKADICEKSDEKSSVNPVEEKKQVPVKRKRGRPRKYPIEIMALLGQVSEADSRTGNMQQSSGSSSRQMITPKVTGSLNERHKEAKEGETEVAVRRRGRKPKRPLIPSEETGKDTLEPDKKRQKLTLAVEEETEDKEEKDENKESGDNGGEDSENSDDADEMHSGATTRSASRLEAQRKQPSKPTTRAASKNQSPGAVPPPNRRKLAGRKQSPAVAKSNKSPGAHSRLQPTKRKREASPLVSPKKSQQRGDEPEAKKSKR
uniref:Biorientation of chromosomes in cell division protein 1-like 1 n=1 Tax=Podarcis muralis TaxID=64176 RepID=A0A670JKA2_PODMU